MRDDYLNQVICRGNELSLLDRATACSLPANSSTVRWVFAAGFALLLTLFPSVCSAQAFFPII